MDHNIRLGPAAIFLTIVAIVLVMLALLTTATSLADSAMAERFASVTHTRYKLEAEGERFLAEAAEAGGYGNADSAEAGSGRSERPLSELEGAEQTEKGYMFISELDGYRIEIEITEPDENGNYEILSRKTVRIWETADPMNNIWQGSTANQ